MKKLFSVFAAALLMLTLSACGSQKRITRQTFAFDTVVNITTDFDSSHLADRAFEICRSYEKIFSRTDSKSELYALNSGSISTPSPPLKEVIDFSLEISRITNGAFDITVAPLIELWDINNRTEPPTDEEIKEALKKVDYNKISQNPFSLDGVSIDLGAVAKGYIADKITEEFKNEKNIIVDLGGNVAVIGEYTVGIRDPFNPEKIFATIRLKDKSAVTSGAYQRYFEYDGVRYHHIIDPRTGNCPHSSIASVTVISPSSMCADALSTAIFVSGTDAISLCGNFPDTDAIIITETGETITTEGFSERYNLTVQ